MTPVLLLTGYLGAGKTTLLNHILTNEHGIRFAVIVNDIGEVNIDATLIQKGGIVGQDQNNPDLVALQNGCICCTLKMDLVQQISDIISQKKFDYIVIEASGVCEPEPIAQTIASMPNMDRKYTRGGAPELDAIVTVVDALRLRDEFECGDALSKPHSEEDIENLIIQQIEFCNIILLNKISEITPAEAAKVKAIVRAIQPKARIIECDYADVPLGDLLNTHLFDFDEVSNSATWIRRLEDLDEPEEHHHHHHHEDDRDEEHEHHHSEHHHHHDADCHCDECCGHHHHHHHGEGETEEYGIQTFVYQRRKPIDINRFDYLIHSKWPKGVIRTKGLVYFAHNTDMCCLFEQAGTQKKLTQSGLWYATAPEEELRQLLEADPNAAKNWDPVYGDRMIKLVFIGRNMDRQAIEKALDATLSEARPD